MSSKEHAERLGKALGNSGICQVVKTDHTTDQVRLLVRLGAGAEAAWTQLIDRILIAGEYIEGQAHYFQSHICKHYFRKEMPDGTKKLVFGWYISIQSTSMSPSLDVVIQAIRGVLPEVLDKKNDVLEMPLSVRGKELNPPNEHGRGAYTVGGKSDFKVRR